VEEREELSGCPKQVYPDSRCGENGVAGRSASLAVALQSSASPPGPSGNGRANTPPRARVRGHFPDLTSVKPALVVADRSSES